MYVHAHTNGRFAWLHTAHKKSGGAYETQCGKILVRWTERPRADHLPPYLALCPLCQKEPVRVFVEKLEPGSVLEAFDGYWWLYDGAKWHKLPRLKDAEKTWLKVK